MKGGDVKAVRERNTEVPPTSVSHRPATSFFFFLINQFPQKKETKTSMKSNSFIHISTWITKLNICVNSSKTPKFSVYSENTHIWHYKKVFLAYLFFSAQLTTVNTINVPCVLYLVLPVLYSCTTNRRTGCFLSSRLRRGRRPSSFNYLEGAGRPALNSDTRPRLSERETDTVSRQEARLGNLGHSGILYDMVTHTHTHSAGISRCCKHQVWMCFLKHTFN